MFEWVTDGRPMMCDNCKGTGSPLEWGTEWSNDQERLWRLLSRWAFVGNPFGHVLLMSVALGEEEIAHRCIIGEMRCGGTAFLAPHAWIEAEEHIIDFRGRPSGWYRSHENYTVPPVGIIELEKPWEYIEIAEIPPALPIDPRLIAADLVAFDPVNRNVTSRQWPISESVTK